MEPSSKEVTRMSIQDEIETGKKHTEEKMRQTERDVERAFIKWGLIIAAVIFVAAICVIIWNS